LSDLAYTGVFFHLLLAFSAHINAGDDAFLPAVIGLIALFVSFSTQNTARDQPSPHVPLSGALP